MNEHFFIYNGEFFRSGVPVISAQNRTFRYGDGLFETMRMYGGKIINLDLHFERLLQGTIILGLHIPSFFSKEYFIDAVNQLLSKNSILQNARIRLMLFHAGENIVETEHLPAGFIIETFPLGGEIQLNEKGLVVDLFPDARKSMDRFSPLKSNNYLASVMAKKFASGNKLDDVLLMNSAGRICESSIANVFVITGEKTFTPPLTEGCIAGVMRRWLISNFRIEEKKLAVEDLLSADELFLTNSIQPVRWVEHFRDKTFGNEKVKEIFKLLVARIASQ